MKKHTFFLFVLISAALSSIAPHAHAAGLGDLIPSPSAVSDAVSSVASIPASAVSEEEDEPEESPEQENDPVEAVLAPVVRSDSSIDVDSSMTTQISGSVENSTDVEESVIGGIDEPDPVSAPVPTTVEPSEPEQPARPEPVQETSLPNTPEEPMYMAMSAVAGASAARTSPILGNLQYFKDMFFPTGAYASQKFTPRQTATLLAVALAMAASGSALLAKGSFAAGFAKVGAFGAAFIRPSRRIFRS